MLLSVLCPLYTHYNKDISGTSRSILIKLCHPHLRGGGHVVLVRILSASASTNYDKPERPMLHAGFQAHRPSGSVVFLRFYTIYGHGGNFYHLIRTSRKKFSFPQPIEATYEFWLQSVEEKKPFEKADGRTTKGHYIL